jgi:phosphoglycerate dehydrogenase-like enzyme
MRTNIVGEEKPIVVILMPEATQLNILSPDALSTLARFAEPRKPMGAELGPNDLPELLQGASVCITGWGTPPLTAEVLSNAPGLQLVAHTAGSIRNLVPPDAMAQGLRVSHAAGIIADAVAEFVISEALLGIRPLHEIDRGMRANEPWRSLRDRTMGRLLGACTVGIVGAGYVGLKVIRLLQAFGSVILVYDPTMSAQKAEELGVYLRSLDDLLSSSDIVSLHAPVLPETRGMIGAAELARLKDGALFINSARSALVDEAALLKELQSGRISAALDVFDAEPLPSDSPFRSLPNVILSPHAAGHTSDTYLRQGTAMVEEVERLLNGEPLKHEVSVDMLQNMA